MTQLQKDRAVDVATFVVVLPFALAISPLLVLIYMWGAVVECWHDHGTRHARNEYLIRKSKECGEWVPAMGPCVAEKPCKVHVSSGSH